MGEKIMQYEILVLDLDGTLTNNKKEITPHTKEVLKAYQEAGGRIVLASGGRAAAAGGSGGEVSHITSDLPGRRYPHRDTG